MEGCRVCPQCGSPVTRPTVQTPSSIYCFCDQCGHAWRDRRDAVAQPDDGRPSRRRTDVPEPGVRLR